MIVGILSVGGWFSLGIGRFFPIAGVSLGVFFASIVAGSVLERRFLFQDHRCQGCGRHHLRKKDWVRAPFGPRLPLISFFVCSVEMALLIMLVRVLAAL